MSVEEKFIEEYAVSPNNSTLAVVVPVGRYYPEEGMARSRIRILDMETKDTIVQLPETSSSYFDSLPWGLEWITDTKLLFRQRDSIVLWDITAKEADIFSVPYGRFSASHYSGEIALWQISNDRNFQLSVDVNIYSYPDGTIQKQFLLLKMCQ